MSESLVRQNYHAEVEAAVNKQINLELHAEYVYLSMAYYFERDDVALYGFSHWCKKQVAEERGHADRFLKFQVDRGGRVLLQNIQKPEKDEWGTPLEAMQAALDLERSVNQTLLDLYKIAGKHDDTGLGEMSEQLIAVQIDSIKEIGNFISGLKRCGPGLGEYMFDRETMQNL